MNLDVMVPVVGALLLIWAIFFQRRHISVMEDTPTSKVRSVAMGFAELKGKAVPIGPLTSPVSNQPCVYYFYLVESEYTDGKGRRHRRVVRQGGSRAPFYLDDGTGRIMVFPHGAQMNVTNRTESLDGELIVTEHCILAGEPLYVAGTVAKARDFAAPDMDAREHYRLELRRIREALADAERDQAQWAGPQAKAEAVERMAAQARGIEAKLAELETAPSETPGEALAVGKGEDESDFLISTESEEEMTSKMETESGIALIAGAAMVLYGMWALMK